MRETVMALAGICMLSAICEQMIDRNRFQNALRVVIGLEITWGLIHLIQKLGHYILEWG